MFSLSLTLSIGVISPTQSAASASTDTVIAVCFAPEGDCAAFAVRAIDNAEREILVAAYRLTVGSGIVGALIRANERGVDVRVIAARRRRADAQVASIRWQPLAYRSGSTIERVSRMPRRWS